MVPALSSSLSSCLDFPNDGLNSPGFQCLLLVRIFYQSNRQETVTGGEAHEIQEVNKLHKSGLVKEPPPTPPTRVLEAENRCL